MPRYKQLDSLDLLFGVVRRSVRFPDTLRPVFGRLEAVAFHLRIEKLPVNAEQARRFRSIARAPRQDRKSTRLNSSHLGISYAVFCLKKKKKNKHNKKYTKKATRYNLSSKEI